MENIFNQMFKNINNKKITKNEVLVNKQRNDSLGTPTFFDTTYSEHSSEEANKTKINRAIEYAGKERENLGIQLASIKKNIEQIDSFFNILNSSSISQDKKAKLANVLIISHERGKTVMEGIEWVILLKEAL